MANGVSPLYPSMVISNDGVISIEFLQWLDQFRSTTNVILTEGGSDFAATSYTQQGDAASSSMVTTYGKRAIVRSGTAYSRTQARKAGTTYT